MSDITMCSNAKDGCKWAKQCARFTATPSEFMQSWQDFYKEGEHCLHFILRVGRK
jgi:hypothetical protein